jgi:hypothetical protein
VPGRSARIRPTPGIARNHPSSRARGCRRANHDGWGSFEGGGTSTALF